METTFSHKLLDLHCDTVTRCLDTGMDFDDPALHLNLNRLPDNLRLAQAAAIFIPDEYRGKGAQDYFLRACELYRRETARKADRLSAVRDLRFLSKRLEEKPVALFLTVEGGAALGGDLAWVERLWEEGVRMMTLTWNGANELCGGVVSGGGFTAFGREAVSQMEQLGMAVDVSHLSDEGFWQLCDFAKRPFCASHSNARAICGHRRNLTDEMFREIARRGGVVGLNYSVGFITENRDTKTIDDLLRHLHHFLALGGEDTVALGSDFDGTDVPPYLAGVWDLNHLVDALRASGLSQMVVEKILYDNAASYLAGLQKGKD